MQICAELVQRHIIGGYMTMEFCFNINETKGYSKCLPHFSLCICYYYWDYYFCNWPSSISFLISFTSSYQLFLFVFCSGWRMKGTQTRNGRRTYLRYIKTRILSLWRIGFLFFAPCRVYRRNVMNEHCQAVWVAVKSECHIVVATAQIQLFIVKIHGILQLQINRSWHLNWGVLHL